MSTIETGQGRGHKITPCLWFDGNAEQAANFYVSVFKNSKITNIARYGDAGSDVSGQPEGSVMTVEFELDGQEFLGLNGGPNFKFTEAVSFIINCDSQEEVDRFWTTLTANGGAESQCGWLKDKFGLSWQVTPTILSKLVKDKDRAKAERVMKAMLQMKKIDIATLEKAAAGG